MKLEDIEKGMHEIRAYFCFLAAVVTFTFTFELGVVFSQLAYPITGGLFGLLFIYVGIRLLKLSKKVGKNEEVKEVEEVGDDRIRESEDSFL